MNTMIPEIKDHALAMGMNQCYQIVPIRDQDVEPNEEEYKRIIQVLARLGQMTFSYKIYKQNGKIRLYANVPQDEANRDEIIKAIYYDVGSCKMEPSSLELKEMAVFSVQGAQHHIIDVDQNFTERLLSLFRQVGKDEELLMSVTVQEVEDHEEKRQQLIDALFPTPTFDWKEKAMTMAKKYGPIVKVRAINGAKTVIETLVEAAWGKKVSFERAELIEEEIEEETLILPRKVNNEKRQYLMVEIVFAMRADPERMEVIKQSIEQLLTDMQGENHLTLVSTETDVELLQEGYFQEKSPKLCFYKKELGQFLWLPRIDEMGEEFYTKINQKTEIPNEFYQKQTGSVEVCKDLNDEKIHYPRPKTEQEKDDWMKSMLVSGEQGSGKTSLSENQILETFCVKAKNREEWKQHAKSVIAFDVADGQMMANVLKHIPDWLMDRVIVLNHADTENVIPVHFHDLLKINKKSRNLPAQIAATETQMILDSLGDDSKTQAMERYLKHALHISYAVGRGNLLDAMRVLLDSKYRKKLMEKTKKAYPLLFVELKQFEKDLNLDEGKPSTILRTVENRIASIRMNDDLMTAVCAKPLESLDFWKWINGDKDGAYLVLIYIPGSGQVISKGFRKFLFTHYFVKIWNLMLAREKIEKSKRKECMVLVDEVHQILDQRAVRALFPDLFKEPRKYRMRFIFTLHGLSSLDKAGSKKEEILESMKEAGANLVLLKGGSGLFNELARIGMLQPFTEKDFHQLMAMRYTGFFRLAFGQRSYVFQAKLLEPAEWRLPVHREMTLEQFHSWKNEYSIPRDSVGKEIEEYMEMYMKEEEEEEACSTQEIDKQEKENAIARITGARASRNRKSRSIG